MPDHQSSSRLLADALGDAYRAKEQARYNYEEAVTRWGRAQINLELAIAREESEKK